LVEIIGKKMNIKNFEEFSLQTEKTDGGIFLRLTYSWHTFYTPSFHRPLFSLSSLICVSYFLLICSLLEDMVEWYPKQVS
jgi:hypothetical protein